MTARVAALALAACLAGQAPAWAQGVPEGVVLASETAVDALAGAQAPAGPWMGIPADEDPTPPATARGRWYTASEWALFGCHALDTAYTQRLIGTGRFHEANPLLGQFEEPGLFVGVKFSIAFGQAKATRTIARAGHPVLAAVTNAAVGGVMCGAALHNARIYGDYNRGEVGP